MSEHEIRRFLRKLVLPTAVGAGLALGACSDDTNGPKPDSKTADLGTTDQSTADQKTVDLPKYPDGLPLPYMAPDVAPLHRHLTRQA